MSTLNAELQRLGIISQDRLEVFYPRVRDRDDVVVLWDPVTEVIVLSRCDHVSESYYSERKETSSYNVHNQRVETPRLEDNIRRAEEFGSKISEKRWLDFGCGLGGMLDELAAQASSATGLEPNLDRASIVSAKGHHVVTSLDEIEDASLDVVTMFHVLEHLTDPLAVLKSVKRVLRPGGVLVIEVPHARDALITLYDCEAFKRFTFWSEHLVLHTRLSLQILLKAAGYLECEVSACQRYPLANHLHWLAKGSPGGHKIWSVLDLTDLTAAYSKSLEDLDRTDSLMALITKS